MQTRHWWITMAKGITNGTVPIGAVAASNQIYDAFMQGPEGRPPSRRRCVRRCACGRTIARTSTSGALWRRCRASHPRGATRFYSACCLNRRGRARAHRSHRTSRRPRGVDLSGTVRWSLVTLLKATATALPLRCLATYISRALVFAPDTSRYSLPS